MNARKLTLIFAAAITLFAQADITLEKATRKETLEGDLKGAIELYRKAFSEAKNDRTVAARALVRMAECYQKLGDAESRKIYEQVLREYADQKEAVTTARAKLGANNPENSGITTRRVWKDAAMSYLSPPSPDGRHIAGQSEETGDLVLRDLGTGEERRLTKKGSWTVSFARVTYSVFSPDGKQIAYVWFDPKGPKGPTYELHITSTNGDASNPRVLPQFSSEIKYPILEDWSPDGRHILANLARKDNTNQIALISVADGSIRVLKSLDWRYPGRMRFSPDGHYIGYNSSQKPDSKERDLFVLATDASRETAVVNHPADDYFLGWAPDSKSILFASDRTGTTDAWTIGVADGKPAGAPALIHRNMSGVWPLGFSKKGAFYYQMPGGVHEIHFAGIDEEGLRLVDSPTNMAERFTGRTEGGAWSPNGQLVAYSVRGDRPSIWIREVGTGEEREIAPTLQYIDTYDGLRWSPDGRSLVVLGRDNRARSGFFRIAIENGHTTPLLYGEPGLNNRGSIAGPPELSPDGKAIYYRRSDANLKTLHIVSRDLVTGAERELYKLPEPCWGQVALSPDGRQLAFGCPGRLLLLDTRGGEPRELLRKSVFPPAALVWTPDGRRLVFAVVSNGGSAKEERGLWSISADGGEPRLLKAQVEDCHGLRIHPNGREIVFSAGKRTFEVWALENFLSGLAPRR
jgi:Tol biopolymer transport system component